MGLFFFQFVCIGLLADFARTQVLQNCSVDTVPLVIDSTEDAAALATSILACPDDDFAVEWVGEVLVEETIRVTGSTSLTIAGAGPGANANGGGDTQLFAVDEGARLRLSGMVLSNGNATYGGAVFANQSSVSLAGNMSFISNSADFGGAVLALESILSWDGDRTEFSLNSAAFDGGAIWAGDRSTVSWAGDGTTFSNNNARAGGAITAYNFSSVSWEGDDTTFSNNSATSEFGGGAIHAWESSNVSWISNRTVFASNNAATGGAILAQDSTVAWEGDGTEFRSNSAGFDGGAIWAGASVVSWNGDGTAFVSNSAYGGGAIVAHNFSSVSWVGDNTTFTSNSANNYAGGAIHAWESSSVSWTGDGTVFTSNNAVDSGGAIFAQDSTVSWEGDGTAFISNDAHAGGAILAYRFSSVSWDGDSTTFSNNSAAVFNNVSAADFAGGAVHAWHFSNVSWSGDSTVFTSNSAGNYGGAIFARDSTVAWEGDYTEFSSNNSAGFNGGCIYASRESTVYWDGDGTAFISNNAGSGGGIEAWNLSTVSWTGDDTVFISNGGGAIQALLASNVSWDGDRTQFRSNFAVAGGALYLEAYSTMSWNGNGTEFISNSAEADGGAIRVISSTVLLDSDTFFSGNFAEESGGAVAASSLDENSGIGPFDGTVFVDNRAQDAGGAIFLSQSEDAGVRFKEVTFESNSAGGAGGAVSAFRTGWVLDLLFFEECTFFNNTADGSGGAVDTLAGSQGFNGCAFVGNSAYVGGALTLGGADAFVIHCSFLSNSATSRGLAIAALASASVRNSSFESNELYCEAGFYRDDTEEESTPRYEAVCLDCPDWVECDECTIERENMTSTCEAPLAHTTADAGGVTLETLSIGEGYWRATNSSEKILACYNADACSGGVTGTDGYCASGYTGPYCSVCEADYSPSLAHTCTRCSSSRRHGLVAATAIAALVAVVVVAAIFKFLLSTEVEEGNIGCFRRRVLQAVPVQALKIVVVVWQILTQFSDAANISYPSLYQDFLSAVDVVNFDMGSVLAAGCLWSGIDFHGRLLVSTLGPLVAVGFLAMTYLIAVRRNSGASSGGAAALENTRHRHVTALLLLTFLVYSSVSSMVFQTFACERLDDGVEYLRADYRIHCTDSRHKAFEVYAAIMVVVYPVGIPLLYAVLLFQRRDVLADADADKTEAQSIAGLWEAYKPEQFYYEVVECARRILLTGVVVFIFPNDAAQIAITMLIAFFFSLVFEVLAPYTSGSDMWLSRGGHVIVFLSMFDLLLLKVDVSGERDQSQAAFAGVLVAGHVLMILVIVVEVVGICYASRKEKVLGGVEVFERPRTEPEDAPVFESAPAQWKSFLRQRSVSEKAGPTRSVSGPVATTGVP